MKKTVFLGSLIAIAGLTACGKTSPSTTSITEGPGTNENSITTGNSETPSVSTELGGLVADFSTVAKDQDMSDTTVSDWVIKASRYSYAGAIKLQNADEYILSPTIENEGEITVNLNIFATGTEGTPWQFDIIGLNDLGTAVETKSVPFGDLPNQIANATLMTWTFDNEENDITQIKIVYVQKLTGANIGIIRAEVI